MKQRSPRGPPLVERRQQLERLGAVLERAVAGEPSVTIVAGEAGIGKTRLVRALEEVARERGLAVLRGDCLRLGDGELPFAPLAAALREVPDETLDRLPRVARLELGGAFPHLARSDDVLASRPESDRHAQRRLFDSLLCLLSELGRTAPLLLVIEDFQWVDRSTRDFAGFLARAGRHERLAAVITYREHDDAPDETVEMLDDLDRLEQVERIDLPALSRAGVDELAHGVLSARAPAPLVDQLHRRSRGNPFFAEELLAAYVDGRGARLPAGVVSTVLQRLRRVSAPARQLLRCTAASRRPVTWEFLTATCGLEEIDLNPALREALDQHLLVEQGTEPAYAFRHELMREAVYEALHEGERRALHAGIAEHLASVGASAQAELAFHWHAAGRTPEALLASLRAGLEADRARAYAAAAHDFRTATQLWDVLGSPPPETPLDRLDLAAHLADALKHAGDYSGAVAVCEEALDALDPAVDPARAAAFHERLGALNSAHSEIALESFGAALDLLPAPDRGKRARLLAEQACALLGLERPIEARERAADALALAMESNASPETLYARTVLGLALVSAGRPEEGEQCLRVALETPTDRAHPDDLLRGYLYLGEACRLRGHFEAACAAMERGSALARELGLQGSFGWYMDANAAADLFHLGHWPEAGARLEEVRDRPLESWAEVMLRQVSGQLALAAGELEDAETELHLGLERCGEAQPESSPPVYATLAELALWRGDPDAARQFVGEGFAAMERTRELLYTPALHSVGARAAADAAAAAMDAGRADLAHLAHADAEALAEDLAERLREHGDRHLPPTAVAHAAACEAEMLRAAAELSRIQSGNRADQWEQAVAAWGHASALWADVGGPYPAAYASLRRAEAILVARRRSRESAEALREAYASAGQIGAALLRSAAEAVARRVRVDLAPGMPSAPRPELPMGLTRREVQTLELLARGMTNREIADELVISIRTVDVHVSRIIAKLGTSNRTEAVAAAHRLGLTGERPPTGAHP
jgi:DNA-binding CsgD family transcriptional regulator